MAPFDWPSLNVQPPKRNDPFTLPSLGPREYTQISSVPEWSVYADRKKNYELTQMQVLMQEIARQRAEDNKSFFDRIMSGGGSILSWTFDKLLRPIWAHASGLAKTLADEEGATKWSVFALGFAPFIGQAVLGATDPQYRSGFMEGLEGKSKKGFGQVLDQMGILQSRDISRGLASFAADIVSDPTSYIGAGLVRAGITGGTRAGKLLGILSKDIVDESDTIFARQLIQEVGDAPEFGWQRALADMVINRNTSGQALSEADTAIARVLAEAGARVEIKGTPGIAQLRLYNPFGIANKILPFNLPRYIPLTPTTIAGKRVAPLGPDLFKTATKGGILGKVPGIAPLARETGRIFKPGFEEALKAGDRSLLASGGFTAGETVRRLREELQTRYTMQSRAIIDKEMRGLTRISESRQLKVLEFISTNPVLKRINDPEAPTGNRLELNEQPLLDANFKTEDIAFARAWQQIMENQRQSNFAAGLRYEKPGPNALGQVYVPHVYEKSGNTIDTLYQTKASSLTQAGFTRERLINASVADIRELQEKGILKGEIMTNPMQILTTRVARGAQKEADILGNQALVRAFGEPEKVLDNGLIDTLERDIFELEDRKSMLQSIQRDYAVGKPIGSRAEQLVRSVTNLRGQAKSMSELIDNLEKEILPPTYKLTAKERDTLAGILRKTPIAENIAARQNYYGMAPLKADIKAPVQSMKEAGAAVDAELDKFVSRVQARRKRALIKTKEANIARKGTLKGETAKQRALNREIASVVRYQKDYTARKQRNLKSRIGTIDKALEGKTSTLTTALRGVANPNVQGMVKLPAQFKTASGKAIYVPSEVRDSLERVLQIYTSDDQLGRWIKAYNNLLGKWKIAVTAINLGYRVRNTMTDMWNMWVSPDGPSLSEIVYYGGKAAALQRRIKKGDPKAVAIWQEAYRGSIFSGLFPGDVQTQAQMLNYFGSKRALWYNKKFLALGGKIMTDFNKVAENWGRLTHYLYRIDNGYDSLEAARYVRMAHFDYEDLTALEKRVFKKILPFYTWTRKNIPYQLQMLVQQPGRMAAFPKFGLEMEEAFTGEDGKVGIPNFIRNNMGIAFGNTYYLPQLGITDLGKIENLMDSSIPWRERVSGFSGMLSPAIKMPMEFLTGISLLTGQSIGGGPNPRNPISNEAATFLQALGLGDLADVGITSRNVNGERMYGAGASPWIGYLAGLIPYTNLFVNQLSDIKREQRGRMAPFMSNILGISTFRYDQETSLAVEQFKIEEEARRLMQKLRDEGVIDQVAERPPSDFDRRFRDLLLNVANGGGGSP